MKDIQFEWNQDKAENNLRKHGVSFEEAKTVFYDENAIEFYDDGHSGVEDRFLLLGMSSRLAILLVCHCYRESEAVIRIISARKATAKEANHYTGGI